MVICTVPIRLYGPEAGEYQRDVVYPDDRLAELHPDNFVRIDQGQQEIEVRPDETRKRRTR